MSFEEFSSKSEMPIASPRKSLVIKPLDIPELKSNNNVARVSPRNSMPFEEFSSKSEMPMASPRKTLVIKPLDIPELKNITI